METKIFLGDGAYVSTGDFLSQFKLTAEDGYMATETIFLEIDMIDRLHQFAHNIVDEGRGE